jgi:hypothetical protein
MKKPAKRTATKPTAPATKAAIVAKSAALQVDPKFAPVAAAFAKNPRVTSGKMMSSFGLRVNGKIFAMFARGAFVAKLPRERVDELVGARKGKHFDPGHGRLMKEWISIPGDTESWVTLAKEAYAFVELPPRKGTIR